jgi:uncharacterized protein
MSSTKNPNRPTYNSQSQTRDIVGTGVGLRSEHMPTILKETPAVPWFEVLIDNYLNFSPKALANLDRIAEHYPLAFHSVGMNLGSVDPLNIEYLEKIKMLITRYNPAFVSDHVCFSAFENIQHHDLLPIPYTKESVKIFSDKVIQVQNFFGRQIAIENPSSYISFKSSEMNEWEFMVAVAQQSNCPLLLDINNIFVSSKNHGFSPMQYIDSLRGCNIAYYHLAGHEDFGTHLLDSHSRPVCNEVWDLFKYAIERLGAYPALIEWDNDIPDFSTLLDQANLAQLHLTQGASKIK